MATVTNIGDLSQVLRVLESSSLADARAELDTLLRLAANAADELGLLATCAADFPDSTVADLARTAARAASDAADELQALRRRLEV
jgi:hypothetical protein